MFWNNNSRSRRYGLQFDGKLVPVGQTRTRVENGEFIEEEILGTYGCGHAGNQEPGGHCKLCNSVICKTCIANCMRCGRTACPSHTTRTNVGPFCTDCTRRIKTAQLVRRFIRAMASLFIEFDQHEDLRIPSWMD